MNKSDSVINLAKALTAFQQEVKNPANTANNPFFKSKYAPLNDILNDVRPLLSKHGLSVLQAPSGNGDIISVTTLLLHSSGEWIEACALSVKADKPTAQGAGSAITYARRYALSAVLGISSEDDDDGNHASGKKDTAKDKPAGKPATTTTDKATEPQLKKIYAVAKNKKLDKQFMVDILQVRYSKSESKELTKKEASDLIEHLGEIDTDGS